MAREKGVATAPCKNCGKDLPLVEQPDGSWTTENCTKCYPVSRKEKANQIEPGRELGTQEVAEAKKENA